MKLCVCILACCCRRLFRPVLCRSAGGVPAALHLLARTPSAPQQLHLLSMVSALARSGGEEAGAELAQAGAPAVLLQMVAVEPMPRTQVGAGQACDTRGCDKLQS